MSPIIASRTAARREFVRRAFDRLGPLPPGMVVVKPGLEPEAGYPHSTHRDLLDAVLELLSGREVAVADGWTGLFRAGSPRTHPLAEVCRRRGHELTDLNDLPQVRRRAGTTEIVMSELPFRAAAIVSLPVLRCMTAGRVTGALANHYGFLSPVQPSRFTLGRGYVHRTLALLNQLAPAALTIVDAGEVPVMSSGIVNERRSIGLGTMFAGRDPVALDAFGLELLKRAEPRLSELSPLDLPQVRAAVDLGLGSPAFEVEWLDLPSPPPPIKPRRPLYAGVMLSA